MITILLYRNAEPALPNSDWFTVLMEHMANNDYGCGIRLEYPSGRAIINARGHWGITALHLGQACLTIPVKVFVVQCLSYSCGMGPYTTIHGFQEIAFSGVHDQHQRKRPESAHRSAAAHSTDQR